MTDTLRNATAFATLALAACAAPVTETASNLSDSYDFGSCGLPFQGPYVTAPVRSLYVPMRDDIRIALDVVLPEGLPQGERNRVPVRPILHRLVRIAASPHHSPTCQCSI